jgi:MFS family permease
LKKYLLPKQPLLFGVAVTIEAIAVRTQVSLPTPNPLIGDSGHLSSRFRLLWTGQSISLIGSQLSTLAIQIIAVNFLHAGAMQMGYLTASQTVPYLLLSLFIGIVIDRTSKRRLLIGADLIRFVTLLFAAVLAAVHHLTIPLLCGIVCFIATFSLIFDAALGALIPQLYDSRQRLIANSRLSITLAGSEVVGPSLAGFLLQILSVTGIMLIDAATYLISALCVLFALPRGLHQPKTVIVPSQRVTVPILGVLPAFVEGIRFVCFQPILRTFAIWSAVWNFSWSAVLAVFVLYASRTLMMSPALIGLVFAIGALGGVSGAFAAPSFTRRWSHGRVLVTAPLIGACGGAVLLLAHLTHPPVMVALGLFLYNFGESSFGVNMQTCRQNVTPFELLGAWIQACDSALEVWPL